MSSAWQTATRYSRGHCILTVSERVVTEFGIRAVYATWEKPLLLMAVSGILFVETERHLVVN